jgi:hypothetical protein
MSLPPVFVIVNLGSPNTSGQVAPKHKAAKKKHKKKHKHRHKRHKRHAHKHKHRRAHRHALRRHRSGLVGFRMRPSYARA